MNTFFKLVLTGVVRKPEVVSIGGLVKTGREYQQICPVSTIAGFWAGIGVGRHWALIVHFRNKATEVNNAEGNYEELAGGQPWKGAAVEVNNAEGNYEERAGGQPWKGAAVEVNDVGGNYKKVLDGQLWKGAPTITLATASEDPRSRTGTRCPLKFLIFLW